MRPIFIRSGVARLYLFGSVARHEARPDSDVDLFFDTDNPRFSLIELVDVQERGERYPGPGNRCDDTGEPASDASTADRRGSGARVLTCREVLFSASRTFATRSSAFKTRPSAPTSTPSPMRDQFTEQLKASMKAGTRRAPRPCA
jgi:hypothetical protein